MHTLTSLSTWLALISTPTPTVTVTVPPLIVLDDEQASDKDPLDQHSADADS